MRKNKDECMAIDERKVAWKVLKIIGMILLGILVAALLGFVIMWLWNWLMPMIFGLTTITYWQGIGVFILAKIIFGGIGSGSGDSEKKHEKGTIRSAIRDEVKKEFDKEFDKDHKNSQANDEEQSETPKNKDYDVLYEKWWEQEGEKSFEKYMDGNE